MKIKFMIIILFLTGLYTNAQTKYEKGYIITADNIKTECYIKNEGWLNTPSSFKYKTSLDSDYKIGTVKNIKEFGIDNEFKFINRIVKIDKSSSDIQRTMSKTRISEFISETLFLKVLLTGKASLFQYKEGNLVRYFFQKESSNIYQLEYKEYINSKKTISKNTNYKLQLKRDLFCAGLNNNIKYQKRTLLKYFNEYNKKCGNGKESITYDYKKNTVNKKETPLFNLKIKAGFGKAKYERNHQYYSILTNSIDGTFYSIGIEGEYTLPFNKNKWSLFIEPNFNFLSGKNDTEYNTIKLPIGVRHYMFLNDSSKLYANAGYIANFITSAKITDGLGAPITLNRSFSELFLGVGYNYKRYYIEARYAFGQTKKFVSTIDRSSSYGLSIGYKLF